MDIGDQWYCCCLGDFFESGGGVFVWIGDMDQVYISFFIVMDLVDCCVGVGSYCIGYGLDCDGCIVIDI